MRIVFLKGKDAPDQLHCYREDGSLMQSLLSPHSAYHDLAHWVVERHFEMTEGFWGIIAQGYSLAEYAQNNASRNFQISAEGYHAEFLATLIQSAVHTGQISEAYYEMLKSASQQAGLPFPELPDAATQALLIGQAQALSKAWTETETELILEFPWG